VLQRRGPRTLLRHWRRSLIRFFVLLLADLATVGLLWAGVRGLRDLALLGEGLAGAIARAIPPGYLGGGELAAALVLGLLVAGTYGRGDRRKDARRLFTGVALAVALTVWPHLWDQGPSVVLVYAIGVFVLGSALTLERVAVDRVVRRWGWRRPQARTVFVGQMEDCHGTVRGPAFVQGTQYRAVGFVDIAPGNPASSVEELRLALVQRQAEAVVICGHLQDAVFQDVVQAAREAGCELLAVPRHFARTGVEPQFVWKRGQPLIELTSPAVKGQELVFKRLADIAVAGVGLLLLSPVVALVAAAIKLESSGPVFYASPRWGRFGTRIRIWKFRTMVREADAVLSSNPQLSAEYNTNIKLQDDPRITRVGRLLRRWSLDELPQLYNVLVGDMSLVGPRPKLPGEEEKFGAALETVLAVRPGLTGLWQISGRNSTTYDERIALDVKYVSHPSFWEDLRILAKTVPVVLTGTGAH
jgi:exopolysaccharide biosynthesis polyprenyl glycosylphosphotransferase